MEQTCFAAVTILLSKVSHEPYGGASATGLTNLLYEVAMPQTLDPACDLSTPEVLLWSLPPAERNIHTISLFRAMAATTSITAASLPLGGLPCVRRMPAQVNCTSGDAAGLGTPCAW